MRKYEFNDGAVISVPNGMFLDGKSIAEYEYLHGKLKSVSYKGKTVLAV